MVYFSLTNGQVVKALSNSVGDYVIKRMYASTND